MALVFNAIGYTSMYYCSERDYFNGTTTTTESWNVRSLAHNGLVSYINNMEMIGQLSLIAYIYI